MRKSVRSESAPAYLPASPQPARDDEIVAQAIDILRGRLRVPGAVMGSPADTRAYLALQVAALEHEVFGVLYLDNQHALIRDEQLFRGTIDGASVYPREVVKAAIAHNAAAVVIYHNHPSSHPEPSQADQRLTQRLKAALGTVDIRVLDHIVIGGTESVSFAERGLL